MSRTRASLRMLAVTTLTATALTVVMAPTSSAGPGGGSTPRAREAATPTSPDAGGAARISTATLVRATALSQLSPPAPDSSGIVYMSDVDRLLVVDSEVNEMPLYQGVNMWQISRAGTAQFDTGTTLGFSKEPTGVGYDPVGKRVFISDDDKERVFVLTAGPDLRFGTADDVVTFFSSLGVREPRRRGRHLRHLHRRPVPDGGQRRRRSGGCRPERTAASTGWLPPATTP